jgi:hypothetical protein
MFRSIIIVLCLASASIAGEFTRGKSGGQDGYWEKLQARYGGYYYKFHADPPPPPAPAPDYVAPPAEPIVKASYAVSYFPKPFPRGIYTVVSVFNGERIEEKGCVDLRVYNYCLHYTHEGRQKILGPINEWRAVAEVPDYLLPYTK